MNRECLVMVYNCCELLKNVLACVYSQHNDCYQTDTLKLKILGYPGGVVPSPDEREGGGGNLIPIFNLTPILPLPLHYPYKQLYLKSPVIYTVKPAVRL